MISTYVGYHGHRESKDRGRDGHEVDSPDLGADRCHHRRHRRQCGGTLRAGVLPGLEVRPLASLGIVHMVQFRVHAPPAGKHQQVSDFQGRWLEVQVRAVCVRYLDRG